MRGLDWLARVGPCPLDAWCCAMGWSEVAARSHARRLEREGWLARVPMSRGEGCLFFATRAGVRAAGVAARPMADGARSASWPTCIATAWTAAWLRARGRLFLGPRELRVNDQWVMSVRWRDRDGRHVAVHRPTFVIEVNGNYVAAEVQLTRQSAPRLQAALEAHATWIVDGWSSAVIWVCADKVEADRVVAAGEPLGLSVERGLLRVELVETLKASALVVTAERTPLDALSRGLRPHEPTRPGSHH